MLTASSLMFKTVNQHNTTTSTNKKSHLHFGIWQQTWWENDGKSFPPPIFLLLVLVHLKAWILSFWNKTDICLLTSIDQSVTPAASGTSSFPDSGCLWCASNRNPHPTFSARSRDDEKLRGRGGRSGFLSFPRLTVKVLDPVNNSEAGFLSSWQANCS